MQISLFGRTDKRACIYTLLKILQPMGDVACVTNNPIFGRLIEESENPGYYQNVAVFITSATADELWRTIDRAPSDFEYVILDNLYNEETTLTLYIKGAGDEPLDEDLIETFPEMQIITMGRGKGKLVVPFTKDLMQKIEDIEYFKQLQIPTPRMLNILAGLLAESLNMPVKDIVKVASKK